ncbi:GntR family transcriptional regulator [Pelagibacterium sediminicola]|uniref:GntR family transcriptional regulator n=1 Tax=Pelagibacterium sediminicola TaxID=2248761 RepID=UPI001300BDEA|nr:GntR family transcriptional regulator [Pelagibacterium sediminicola]
MVARQAGGNARQEQQPVGPAPRLYAQVYDIIAARIADGTLAAGTRLQESQLAAEFGISRAPTRQALSELEAGGLVTKAEGRGYIVSGAHKTKPAVRSAPAGPVTLNAGASWERIHAEVESEIIARISFGSWRVNEVAMARHYGVSRTVVRDVMGRLQQRGIVRKDDAGRWLAPALTPDHIGEVYEMRWLLEPAALMKAAPNLPESLLATMSAALDRAIAHAHEIGGEVLDTLEDQLHVQVLSHCRQDTLMRAIVQHQSLLVAHHFLYRWTPQLFSSEPFLPEHREILDLLALGRPRAAADSLERHLKVSRDRAVARVELIKGAFNAEDISFLTLVR